MMQQMRPSSPHAPLHPWTGGYPNGSHRSSSAHDTPRHRLNGPWPPGAAYRSSAVPPPEFTAPLLPPHLEIGPKLEHQQPHADGGPATAEGEEQILERGISDDGRVTIDTSRGSQAVARSLDASDEPSKYYWTFDADGQPLMTRYNPRKRTRASSSSSPPPSQPLPLGGNRGLKLRPATALTDTQPRRDSGQRLSQGPADSSAPKMLTHAIDADDELITSNAPKWNAFGRLAPWTSGIAGPLTGQGEEEVGPTAFGSAEEGDVGERRPRRGDRETNDRLRIRLAALQRAGVRSLITSSPPPRRGPPEGSSSDSNGNGNHPTSYVKREESPLLPSSPPSLRRQLGPSIPDDTQFTTSSLAPTLLQPVLSPLDLLQSRTLRHTFRNPHLQALAKTTLDLGESDHQVRKCVGGFWAVLEEEEIKVGLKRQRAKDSNEDDEAADTAAGAPRRKESRRERRDRYRRTGFSPDIIGAKGCSTMRDPDELNPTFSKLEEIFITDEDGGLRISMPLEEGQQPAEAQDALQEAQVEEQRNGDAQGAAAAGATTTEHTQEHEVDKEAHPEPEKAPTGEVPADAEQDDPSAQLTAPNTMSVFLPPSQQREILLASLSCLHELSSDATEYSARLQEIRGRLSEIQRKRDKIWRALRIWAVRRVEESLDVKEGESETGDEELNGLDE